MAEGIQQRFEERYKRDIGRARTAPVHSYEMALRLRKSVKNVIAAREKKHKALKPLQKIEALRLYRNNKRYHSFDEAEIYGCLMKIAELDFKYIMQCRWGEEFAEELLAGEDNLAKCGMAELYSDYEKKVYSRVGAEVAALLKLQEEDMNALKPRGERRFILHIGGTNSGKTHMAIERLKQADKGVYAGPLRLLALEVYDKLLDAGVACSMITGQEQYNTENSRCTSATVEMVDPYGSYDVAVIDEVQMINDPYRGHVWLNLILHLRADEIHLCMAPEVESIICSLLDSNNENYEIVRHERNTELVFEDRPYNINSDITKGDALILFSKREVLDIAARLEQRGIKVSTIYGSLPPQIRKMQFDMFLSGDTEVVVATDAIGLGVNLPIRRIVFMNVFKFDGMGRRQLNEYEIRQIAGRAGRRGIYDCGYVTALSRNNVQWLKEQYGQSHQVDYVRIGFPKSLLDIKGPLDVILEEWDKIQPEKASVRKIDIKEYVSRYRLLYPYRKRIEGFEDNRRLFDLVSCDVDINNDECIKLWKHYCLTYNADKELDFPGLESVCAPTMLEKAELYYKQLDLYNQFSRRMGKKLDEEQLEKAKCDTERLINEELLKNKEDYLKRCSSCGKILPMVYRGKYCIPCEQRRTARRGGQWSAGERFLRSASRGGGAGEKTGQKTGQVP